jgi:hypothetical protein
VIMVRQHVIGLFFMLISPFVMAEWQLLSEANPQESKQYIDLQNVKQTGPMAIYRQVRVLTQGAAVAANGVLSTLALYEYDCMNTKFRLLQTSGFSRQWAEGERMTVSTSSGPIQWLSLSAQTLGQKTFDLLCPDGNDN